MMKKNVYIFLFDGWSDWEIAYLSPEINKHPSFELIYFSKTAKPVVSMGGLQVQTKLSLENIDENDIDLLILPGGVAWEKDKNNEIEHFVRSQIKNKKPIGAICAATTYLAKLGMLNTIKHTSNDLNYLKGIAPNYIGEALYEDTLALTDQHVITANGIAPIEFAKEIFIKIELFDGPTAEKWFQLFKNGIWSD